MATYHNDISTKCLIACSRNMLMSGGGGDGGGVKGGQPMTTVQDCFSTFINVIPLDIFGLSSPLFTEELSLLCISLTTKQLIVKSKPAACDFMSG